jgi:hypothetical protein
LLLLSSVSAFQQFPRIQLHGFESPLGGDIDEVRRAARTIGIAFMVVKGD